MFSISDEDFYYGIAIVVTSILFLLLSIVAQVLYLVTASRVLQAVRPKFRLSQPGQVWLNFIPIFGLIWPFIINQQIIASVHADLADRGLPQAGNSEKITAAVYPALRLGIFIPYVRGIFAFAFLAVFIMWWVQLFRYKTKLRVGLYAKRDNEGTVDNF